MKNFLLQKNVLGKSSWILLHMNPTEDGEVEYQPFTEYVAWMQNTKGYATNTISQYAGHTARFLDFIYEATSVVTDPDFSNLIYLYQEYLLFGKDSEIKEVAILAERLNKNNKTSVTSISQGIEAAIILFIKFQIVRSESINASNVFARHFTIITYLTHNETQSIKKNSWLAGTIKNCLTRMMPIEKDSLFTKSSRRAKNLKSNQKNATTKAFPLDLSVPFLTQNSNSRTFYRDMCFISFLAASGARTSECLQIKKTDIDTKNQKVFLRNPFDCRDGLTEIEYTKLAWKGRATEETFLIEPFNSIFWDYLKKYLSESYRTNVNHEFIFQKSDGRPLFMLGRSNLDKIFKKFAKGVGITNLSGLSLHSLRHMYGFYVLNYLPINDGKQSGLSMSDVQILMGHASIKSTERYALHDIDLVRMHIEFASKMIKQNEPSINDLRDLFIDRHIAALNQFRGERNV